MLQNEQTQLPNLKSTHIKCCYPNCPHSFSSMSAFSDHFNIHYHPNLKCPYPSCAKVFKAFSRLKRHLFGHSKYKNFACPICFKQFTLDYNMRAHFRRHFHPPSLSHEININEIEQSNSADIQRCTVLIREIFKNVLTEYKNNDTANNK